jgi:iron complex outermembrane receptor protein
MNELQNTKSTRSITRQTLLSAVSAAAMVLNSGAYDPVNAAGSDVDRPILWIELGGQFAHIQGQGDAFPVGFLAANPTSPVLQPTTPLQAERPIPFSFSADAKLSLQPSGSDWAFSAAVNYGRSNNFRHVDHQTTGTHPLVFYNGLPSGNIRGTDDFADTQVHHRESHAIVDFTAGKDVGLGMFGREATSQFNLGVRFAQFISKSTFDVRARPDLGTKYLTNPTGNRRVPLLHFHTYHLTGNSARSFHGIGPSLSWNVSAPVAGSLHDGETAIDWGINAAMLFGRQKAFVQHTDIAHYHTPAAGLRPSNPYVLIYQHTGGHVTTRSVVVPNVGAKVGATYRIENFEVSAGYRADFFFGAVDGGIDARKTEMLGFYGPFAKVSVGFGG